MDKMNFSRYGTVRTDEDGTEIIEINSDLENDDDIEQPRSPLLQQTDNEPMDLSIQFKTEMVDDPVDQTDTMNPAHDYMGGVLPPLNEQIDVPYPLNPVQSANVQLGAKYVMDLPATSAQFQAAASSAMITPPTAEMTPTHTSSLSSSSNTNNSTKSRLNFQSCSSQNQIAHAENNQNITNSSFGDLFKNTDAQTAQAVAQFIDSKVKQHMEEAMNQLKRKYNFVPKGQNDTDSKPQTQKRKHHHKLDNNAAVKGHGHNLRPYKKMKLARRNRSPSLGDLFGPSTSTSKNLVGKRSSSNGGKGSHKKTPSSSSCGNKKVSSKASVSSISSSTKSAQSKPKIKDAGKKKKKQTDCGAVKNVDKSLYLTSKAAKKCPLCNKAYKRMVSHLRNVHTESEVFVSRLSPKAATTLKHSSLMVTKYARANGMQHLKMWCPFCECDKDFYTPYWSNHIRTHTGEYTNKCIVCSKISLNASHCGQSTIKQKCNLNKDGVSAYLCKQCNWVQINKERVKSHVKIQHGIVGSAYQNEFQKITIIPALNQVGAQINPTNAIVHVSTLQQQQPLIAANDRPTASASSTGIQVLENILLRPPTLNLNVGANATGFADTVDDMLNDSPMDLSFSDGLNVIPEANQLLNDGNDDIQMWDEFPTGQNSAANTYEMIKVDTMDDQVLQKVFDGYNEEDTNSFVVRPWLDGDYGLKKSCIDEICQFALYKCMYEKCVFATDSMENWQIHMGAHGQLIEFFQKKDSLLKITRDKLIMYRECPYCSFTAKADHQVLRHIEEDHRRSIFQCKTCYYRTIEMDNMVLHMRSFHPDETKEILLCGETRELLQQDEEVLNQDCEIYVKKIQCGDCTEEYACYNSLYEHLLVMHANVHEYTCPYCMQTMDLDEPTIVDHLKNCGFPEFECLKCHDGFNDVHAIREHMSMAHPSNYLFVGARRTKQPCEDQDEIQLIYIGDAQNTKSYSFIMCADPNVLDGMNAKELTTNRQLNELKNLHMENPFFKITYKGCLPRMVTNQIISDNLEYLNFCEYAELNKQQAENPMPLLVSYKCLTHELMDKMPSIASFIDGENDIIQNGCSSEETADSMTSMLLHRFKNHQLYPIVFLQTENQLPFIVQKIVRCTLHCQLCADQFVSHMALLCHFYSTHSTCWIAAKISIQIQVIESNDPQQPIGSGTTSTDYFYCTILKCSQSDCNGFAGTRTQAIAHYNDEHNDGTAGSQIDKFQVTMAEHIVPHEKSDMRAYMVELQNDHQMYLLECQHCWKLFDSLDAINGHFNAIRTQQNIHIKRRFSIKRLYRLEDNTVRTFAGIQQYANKHADQKSIVPVNMQFPSSICGLCNYNFKFNGNWPAHFEQKHTVDDTYKDEFLSSLNLGEIKIDQCQFSFRCCCAIGELSTVRHIVDHLLNCERRFVCAKCPGQKFTSTVSFVAHYIHHDQNAVSAKMLDDLHNFDAFFALFANMQIILPNGLVVVMHEIRDTTLGFQFQCKIRELAQVSWEREKMDLNLMTMSQ